MHYYCEKFQLTGVSEESIQIFLIKGYESTERSTSKVMNQLKGHILYCITFIYLYEFNINLILKYTIYILHLITNL